MDEKDLKEEELLREINQEIAKQIAEEMGDDPLEEPEEIMIDQPKRRFKKRYIAFGVGGLVLVVILSVVLIVNGMLQKIKREHADDVQFVETDLEGEELENYKASLANATEKPYIKAEEDVINILLIGEEAIQDNGRGRSDSMMIASINQVEKTLSLTSILRDSYVKIPGYKNNKLNSAYTFGGGVLLTQTIEENFGIQIDGYVRVNFDGFETIVDMLGGVNIELGVREAGYLQTTNYISKKKYRTVVPGWNLLNGNQALGYCRVRKVPTITGENNDYGRTYRQRAVLNAIFDKFKTKNPVEMVKIANSLMDYVTTNLTTTEMVTFITTAAYQGTTELRTFRIPADNTFQAEDRYCGGSVGDVLTLDFEENIRLLREFIYGEQLIAELGPIPTNSDGVGIHGTEGKVYNVPKPATQAPVWTPAPTARPTAQPTAAPTLEPTPEPTLEPTVTPEDIPSMEPTLDPGMEGEIDPPEEEPGDIPSAEPTVDPSIPSGEVPEATPPVQSSDDGSMPDDGTVVTPPPATSGTGAAKAEGQKTPSPEEEQIDDADPVTEEDTGEAA